MRKKVQNEKEKYAKRGGVVLGLGLALTMIFIVFYYGYKIVNPELTDTQVVCDLWPGIALIAFCWLIVIWLGKR